VIVLLSGRHWCTSVWLQHSCGYSVGNSTLQSQLKLSRSCVSRHCWCTFHQTSCLKKNVSGGKKSEVLKGTLKPPIVSKIEVSCSTPSVLSQLYLLIAVVWYFMCAHLCSYNSVLHLKLLCVIFHNINILFTFGVVDILITHFYICDC
jgi:hypothetical protein